MIAFFSLFSDSHVETPVRATLADGQVLMGEVRTRTLRLVTGAGVLDIDLDDVGEVVPARGDDLGVAEGLVNVWLKNGSELRGRWSDPALEMGIAVGGAEVPVDLPMNELARFQLHGREQWPTSPVFRMRTSWGDDFLVDPAHTRLVLENQLGTFSPLLEECVSASPVDKADGNWRIVLQTGTVLVGRLQDAAVTVALPMGPKEITVPLANFVSLRLETWGPPPAVMPTLPAPHDYPVEQDRGYGGPPSSMDGNYGAETIPTSAGPAPGRASVAKSARVEAEKDGWFDSRALDETKAAQGE